MATNSTEKPRAEKKMTSYKKWIPDSSHNWKKNSWVTKKKEKGANPGNFTEITYVLWELKPLKGLKNWLKICKLHEIIIQQKASKINLCGWWNYTHYNEICYNETH